MPLRFLYLTSPKAIPSLLDSSFLQALYANLFGFMLLTTESIADLQSRVSCNIAAEDFRPNILVKGTKKPFDEDEWQYIRIGDAVFRNVVPCGRYAKFLACCSFTAGFSVMKMIAI